MNNKHDQKNATKKTTETDEWAAHVARLAEKEAQVRAEFPAFRKTRHAAGGPDSLIELVADAVASSEDGRSHTFCSGMLESMADDLHMLYVAATHPQVEIQPTQEEMAIVIWRLSKRARAAREIVDRMRAFEKASEVAA